MESSSPHRPEIEILHARDARQLGDYSQLLTERRAGRVAPLRRGVYAVAASIETADPRARHRALAYASDAQRVNAVFAGLTAAIIHRLPVIGPVPSEVQLLSSTSSGRRRNGTREFARTGTESIVTIDGLAVTSLGDTLIDVMRREPLITALAMTDAALYTDRSDRGSARSTMEELSHRASEFAGRPGSRKIDAVLRRATTLAESPLESLSRWRIEQLGGPSPVLQHAVVLSSGRVAHLDFAWPELGLWGEADGAGKYLGLSDAGANGMTTAQIVITEKRREDEIRGITGWRCIRWGWSDAWDVQRFRTLLARTGLPLDRRAPPGMRQFGRVRTM